MCYILRVFTSTRCNLSSRSVPRFVVVSRLLAIFCLFSLQSIRAESGSNASSNPQNSVATPATKAEPKMPLLEFQEMFRNASTEDLKSALTNEFVSTRTRAVKVIKRRADKSFVPDLLKSLKDERAQVRVEAAKTLESFGDPAGKAALIAEMPKAKETQDKITTGKVRRTYYDIEDLNAWTDGAGMLAEWDDKSGYTVVKMTVLSNDLIWCKEGAVLQLPKFVRFKDPHIDAEQVLLATADDAVKRVDKQLADKPDHRPGEEIGYFDLVSRMLAKVGGEQEIAKLNLYTQHKNPDVSRYATIGLRIIERNKQAQTTPASQNSKTP